MAINPTREEYMAAFRGAPELVREATLSDDSIATIDQIRIANKLHIDDSGRIGRLLNYLLLGIIEPEQFKKELLELGMEESEAGLMLKEVNEKVFKPLQKKMRDGVRAESEEEDGFYDPYYETGGIQENTVPIAHEHERVTLLPTMQVGENVNFSDQDFVYANAHSSTPQASVPTFTHPAEFMGPQPVSAAVSSTPQASGVVATVSSEPYLPYARTMAEDMERAAHGLTGTPASPARSFQTASVPVTFAQPRAAQVQAPVAQPQTMPAPQQQQPAQPLYAPASVVTPWTPSYPSQFSAPQQVPVPSYAVPTPPSAPVMAPVRLTPIDRSRTGNAPITKEFGSDPYREPISV
jgi:hypothetical protein